MLFRSYCVMKCLYGLKGCGGDLWGENFNLDRNFGGEDQVRILIWTAIVTRVMSSLSQISG